MIYEFEISRNYSRLLSNNFLLDPGFYKKTEFDVYSVFEADRILIFLRVVKNRYPIMYGIFHEIINVYCRREMFVRWDPVEKKTPEFQSEDSGV